MKTHTPTLHEIRVAALLAEPHESYARLVALHHDALEDGHISASELYDLYGMHFVKTVRLLTRGANETYAQYIDKIIESKDVVALLVKRADILDHFMNAATMKESLAPRYAKALAKLNAELANYDEQSKICKYSDIIYV